MSLFSSTPAHRSGREVPSFWTVPLLLILLLLGHHIPRVDSSSRSLPAPDLGTTLVALRFRNGVIIAADSRTSIAGKLVSHRYAQKLVAVPVTTSSSNGDGDDAGPRSFCVMARSGSAADTQYLTDLVQKEAADRYYRYGRTLTVPQVAHYLRSLLWRDNNNNQNGGAQSSSKQVSLVVAGYQSKIDDCDNDGDDDSIHIYSLAASGALLCETNYVAAGSGSTFILGYLDQLVQDQLQKQQQEGSVFLANNRNSMKQIKAATTVLMWDKETAMEVCRRVVQRAIDRDASSGGIIRMMICSKDGIQEETVYPQHVTINNYFPNHDDDRQQKQTSQSLAGFAHAAERW